jgi:serine/threonine protein phosphatase 1
VKNPIKTLEPNLVGRDFVIGDLHGSFSILENLTKNVKFNYETDRMISVGDIVDRGPDSPKCLALLREPWFHSVLGNHEQMMIGKFADNYIGNYWYGNGGSWGIEAVNTYNAIYVKHTQRIPSGEDMMIIDMLPVLEELPFIITVKTKSGKKYHIIHAELPTGVGTITDAQLASRDKLLSLATVKRGDGDAFLWSRFIFGAVHDTNLSNKQDVINYMSRKNISMFNDELETPTSLHETSPPTIKNKLSDDDQLST